MQNWVLAEQLERMRHDDMRHQAEHARLLAEHGLDLWSVLRRAVGARLARRPAAPVAPVERVAATSDVKARAAA